MTFLALIILQSYLTFIEDLMCSESYLKHKVNRSMRRVMCKITEHWWIIIPVSISIYIYSRKSITLGLGNKIIYYGSYEVRYLPSLSKKLSNIVKTGNNIIIIFAFSRMQYWAVLSEKGSHYIMELELSRIDYLQVRYIKNNILDNKKMFHANMFIQKKCF